MRAIAVVATQAGADMETPRTPQGRAAAYRREAELARKKALTLTDASARATMLEVAKTLDALAEIEDRVWGQRPKDKAP
ncbi:MAG TPA: hypothetical protein VK362_06530 [Reyranella sp.]|nr:hypothetical protein [Reyranella sp.]